MEIGDRLVETFPGKVDEIELELADGLGDAERLFRRLKHVVGSGIGDENVGTPAVAAAVVGIGFPRRSPEQPDGPAAGFSVGGMDLVEQMSSDPVQIFHHIFRFPESVVIDALEYIIETDASLVECQLIGVVDIAPSEGDSDQKITVNDEIINDISEFCLGQVHLPCRLSLF